jgi:lysophospholipase
MWWLIPFFFLFCGFFDSHADLLPAQKFLQMATSSTIAHPLQPNLHNHYYKVNPGQKTAIVFLPGMGEPSLKYYDLYEELQLKNTTFYSWDHIGQGFSSHLLPDETIKIHIDRFETHLSPLSAFLKQLRSQHDKVFIIAHSMGAHLALRIAAEHPGWIDGMMFSAPLFDINPRIKPGVFLNWFLSFYNDSSYPPLYGFFRSKKYSMGLVTNSVEREMEYKKIVAQYPEIKRQGATVGWVRAAQESIESLKKTDLKQIAAPVLLLQAETDYLVDNAAQDQGCAQLPRCQKEVMKNSKHEILFEVPEVRTRALDKIRDFIRSNYNVAK